MTINWELLITGGAIASGTAILYQIRKIPAEVYKKVRQSLIYTCRIYQYDELFDMMEKWLFHHHHKKYRDVEACYKENNGMQPCGGSTPSPYEIIYKQEENIFTLNYKSKKILISKSKEKIEKAQSMKDVYFRKFNVSGIGAKKEITQLLHEILEWNKQKEENNIVKIYNSTTYGDFNGAQRVRIKPLQKTILPSLLSTKIVSDIDKFICSESWYISTSIPYKRGYCFHGPPGTGKTTLALALAHYTKRGVYCLNLNSLLDDSKLPYSFSQIPESSILLLEDIDRVFSGRENVSSEAKITFSSLLNCMDGAFYKHGLITIITTNHLEKLDPALMRTGRVDLCVEIPLPGKSEIMEYVKAYYNLSPDSHYPAINKYTGTLKMSDVQEICLSSTSADTSVNKILT